MSSSINVTAISGNLTRDAEQRGAAVKFTVAVNDRAKNKETGEWEDRANFVPCVMFGNYAAALFPYLLKGTPVSVQGSLRWSQWEAQDGTKRSALDVVADTVVIGRQAEGRQAARPAQARGDAYAAEDIPF